MVNLLVHESAGVREFEIVDSEVHVGRELDNTLRLPDPSISRHHCVLRKTAGGYEIQDLQSSNGVVVNGNRVQAAPLRDGDRISLGQVQLTFHNPRPEPNAEELAQAQVPVGTVRISADDLAAIHQGQSAAARPLPSQDQIATGPVPMGSTPPIPPVASPLDARLTAPEAPRSLFRRWLDRLLGR